MRSPPLCCIVFIHTQMVKVAVCGCGFLGSSIAGCLIFHGHDVVVYDINRLALEGFHDELRKKKLHLLERELIIEKAFSGSYRLVPDLEAAVKDVNFVIEAVKEDVGVKRAFFQRVSNACRPDTVLLTSSINLRLEDIFALTLNKERTLGLRFLHPVFFVKDVEVRYHEKTSEEAKDKVRSLIEVDMRKTLFIRFPGQEPFVLPDEEIAAMEQARKIELQRRNGRRNPQPVVAPGNRTYCHGVSAWDRDGHDNSRVMRHAGHGAAANDVFQAPPEPLSVALPLRSFATETCPICAMRPTMCVISPCLHQMCKDCAKSLMNRGTPCPVQRCAREVHSYQPIGSP